MRLLSLERLESRLLLAGDAPSCAALVEMEIADTEFTMVRARRTHCSVRGAIEGTILFDLKIPYESDWNGKFLMAGKGGFAGSLEDDFGFAGEAFGRGYATVITNTGHVGSGTDGSWALNNVKAQEDWGYRAVHLVTTRSKEIIESFHATEISHSYFMGCSGGGRQGMMESQRFPEDFDGIIAQGPVFDLVGVLTRFVWNQQAMHPDGPSSQPTLPNAKAPVLRDAVLEKCDTVDGLTDGLIENPFACRFTPQVDLPICPVGTDSHDCFTAEQISVIERIFENLDYADEKDFPGHPIGGENSNVWRLWHTYWPGLASGLPNLAYTISQEFMRYFVFNDPSFQIQDFDFETDIDGTLELTDTLNATNPDLTEFKDAGGKMIIHHGWIDHSVTPLNSIKYYDQVVDAMGGVSNVDDFLRLFLMPGAGHCDAANGVGPATADWLTALEGWVEQDIPPDSVIASGGTPARTRPVCPYPQQAIWDGVNNPDVATSFSCGLAQIPGDLNQDGTVNFDDFLGLAANFGVSEASREDGDLDESGEVDFTDFLILSANFGVGRLRPEFR